LQADSTIPTVNSSSEDSSSSDDDSSSSEEDSDSDEFTATSPGSSPTQEKEFATNSGQDTDTPRGILIFTKSNETAVRLGRLLTLIDSSKSASIGTLTSTTSTSSRRKTIHSFSAGKLSILVASDLVSRGLDLPNLAHVINYDIPSSLTNYVHRVGRTARAGRKGWAWTMFTPTEGRWFWQEIARSSDIIRQADTKVSRVNIDSKNFNEDVRARYETALEELGQEARRTKINRPERKN
jgi:ATP-dependent RNA helicase DDX51/DBP6